jgi:glycosyltransferase involved in cell wall biosynthesis
MRRIAIVHDWLTTYAGAERVLEQMLALYPQADLFSVCDFLPELERAFLQGRTPKTTFIQHLPGARKRYRQYLPLMPLAVELLDLSGYDIVLSSSHAVAKGVLTGPDQLHISYVHSPIRYAWDLQHQYLRESGLERGFKGRLAQWLLHKIRQWDLRTANGVDCFIANSDFIARRIWKVYRRKAVVIYPPVDVSAFPLCEDKQDFYLTASRMVPYKKMDLIAEAFTAMPEKRLVVIGDGPDMKKIRTKAGTNIQFLGFQPFDVLRDHMQRASAFVFAAEEDFGITPVEAQACGTPVIAYGRGGALETVLGLGSSSPTGVFFDEQTVDAVIKAVASFEHEGRRIIQPEDCRRNAERFAPQCFREALSTLLDREWASFQQRSGRVGD